MQGCPGGIPPKRLYSTACIPALQQQCSCTTQGVQRGLPGQERLCSMGGQAGRSAGGEGQVREGRPLEQPHHAVCLHPRTPSRTPAPGREELCQTQAFWVSPRGLCTKTKPSTRWKKKIKNKKKTKKPQATHSRRYWPPTCILMFSQSPGGSCSNHRCLSLRMAHPPLRERAPHPTRWSREGAASVPLCPVPHRSAALTLAALGVSSPTQSPSGA